MRATRSGRHQRGVTLIGLLFWGVLIAFAAVVGMKVVPTAMEYFTIQKAVTKIAVGNPATVSAARTEFQRIKDVEYSIQLDPADLVVTKENDKVVISFAYEREIHIGGPAYLVMKYEGQSR
jgi:hypothetical protein